MRFTVRGCLTVCAHGVLVATLATVQVSRVSAHGTEARYVQEVDWPKPRIAHTYGLSCSELGP